MFLPKQTKLSPEPFKFYMYNGKLLNLRVNEKFKSYHIISTEYPTRFSNLTDFIEKKVKTQNKINGKNIMEEISLNIFSRQHPGKSIFFTSGVYNNGEKNHDAIIIHSKDENDKEFDWFVDSMSNCLYHDLLSIA